VDRTLISRGGLRAEAPKVPVEKTAGEKAKPTSVPKTKVKNDPKMAAAARELRDRYLEEVNSGRFLPPERGRYDVSRQIADKTSRDVRVSPIVPLRALPEAA
jgi:hypothetical protein